MGARIINVETIRSDLQMTWGALCRWNSRKGELPAQNPLEGMKASDFGPSDWCGDAARVNFRWSGTGSGNAYMDTLAEFAQDLHGDGEFILTWDDGLMNAIRIQAGVVTVHRVTMALGEEIETLTSLGVHDVQCAIGDCVTT